MGIKELNILAKIQRWLNSVNGKTFMNYAYSWGAAVVVLGALFKITHLPGSNLMLFIGMGTEVFVFFISGFDRPFDAGLQREIAEAEASEQNVAVTDGAAPVVAGGGVVGGGTVIIAGGGPAVIGGGYAGGGAIPAGEAVVAEGNDASAVGGGAPVVLGGGGGYVGGPVGGQPFTTEMEEATAKYVEQLQKLTETLEKVSKQAELMTGETEEMAVMNRNITGINAMYELQFRTVSAQMATIDQINEENRKMVKRIEELNAVYTRMLEAMTTNMNMNLNKQ
ncbi:MAG: gliding motility protein GldL [Bacteroidaceae bacterium]|nr:gliding motility protein GldL [Bacteroidaceae bacterium]